MGPNPGVQEQVHNTLYLRVPRLGVSTQYGVVEFASVARSISSMPGYREVMWVRVRVRVRVHVRVYVPRRYIRICYAFVPDLVHLERGRGGCGGVPLPQGVVAAAAPK